MGEDTRAGQWSDLSQRLLSGGIAAAIGLWLMWLGGLPFKFLIAIIVGLMVWEVARMVGAAAFSTAFGALAAVVCVTVGCVASF